MMLHSAGRIISLGLCTLILSGCGSIISRVIPGQGHNHQYYPGVRWDMQNTPWRVMTVIDLPLSAVLDTLLLPIDNHHGSYE